MRAKLLCALGLLLAALVVPSPAQASEDCQVSLGNPGGTLGGYGFYDNYNGAFGLWSDHQAQDFWAPDGTIRPFDVFAGVDGNIIRHEDTMSSGGVIEIRSASCPNVVVQYVHMDWSTISSLHVGQTIYKGQMLGVANGSGYLSSGPHLHLKLFVNGIPVDPLLYMEQGVAIGDTTRTFSDTLVTVGGNYSVVIIPILLGVGLIILFGPKKSVAWVAQTVHSAVYWTGLLLNGATKGERARRKARRKLSCLALFSSALVACPLTILALVAVVRSEVGAQLLSSPGRIVSVSLASSETPLTNLPDGKYEVERAKISHYWPPLGGPNCSNFVDGECVSHMASGLRWQDYVDTAVACPAEYPFGTRFLVFGKLWTCLDRGGAIIRTNDNSVWLDLLTPTTPVPFGTEVEVLVIRPK